MSHRWRPSLRRALVAVGGLAAAAIIAVAVLLALGQLLLPLAAHYPRQVASLLSSQLHQPVAFRSMQGHWQVSGPLLTLRDVTVGETDGQAALQLPRAQVKLDLGAWLSPSRHLVNLRLSGMRLELRRDADGRWHVAGFGQGGRMSHHVSVDDLPGNLWMRQVHVGIDDVGSGRHFDLQVPALRVVNGSGRLRFAGRVRRPGARGAMRVVGDLRPGHGSGRIYAAARHTDLGAVLNGLEIRGVSVQHGQGTLQAWLDWRRGQLHAATMRIDLKQLQMDGPHGTVQVPAWRARVRLRRDASGTGLFYDAGAKAAARVSVTGSGAAQRLDAAARDIDLSHLRLLSVLPSLPGGMAHWLAASGLHGRLGQSDLRWSAAHGLQHLHATLQHVALEPVDGTPGIAGIDAVVRGDAEAVSITLPDQATTIALPSALRHPLKLQHLDGTLVAWRGGGGWSLGTDALDMAGDGYATQLRGHVLVPGHGKKPFVDASLLIDHADMRAIKAFWPRRMHAKTVRWLDSALQSGRITSGRALLHGSLDDWPFTDHRGRFEAQVRIHDASFVFSPDWPQVQHIDAVARFAGGGLTVTASNAQAHGVTVNDAVAAIADFSDPQLQLHASGSGSGADLIGFVRDSPIAARHADVLRHLSLTGRGTFDFSLMLPLGHRQDALLAGTAQLENVDVTNPDWHLDLAALNGALSYDMHGMHADDLHATLRGAPVTLRLALGAATGDAAVPVRASMQGTFALSTLLHGVDTLAPLKDIGKGKAPFEIGVDVRSDRGDAGAAAQLQVRSNLRGMQLQLPLPLRKSAEQAMPLHMTMGLPVSGSDMKLRLGPLRMHARLPGDAAPLAMAVDLGSGAPQNLPAHGIRISGDTPELDLSGWARRALALAGGASSGKQLLQGVDVRTDQALLFGDRFGPLHVRLQPGADQITLHFSGPRIQGLARLPTRDLHTRGITAQFKRLYWPSDKAPPASTGSSHTQKAGATPRSTPQLMGVAPASVPPLHVWMDDFRLGQAHLGQVRLESWPTTSGMHIDQLRTHSPAVQLSASGDWNGSADDSHTHMVIDFGARNLGKMLSALGFAGVFDGGRTHDHLDATWPGPPSAVSLANMTGTLQVHVSDGRIPEVKPGMGRLLGLMSVTELPRRLSSDFGGAFGKGLGFDAIEGTFRLADGNAWTDGLTLSGSAVDVTVSGRIGLRARDYDQRIDVTPHVGNSLPIVGALAGGPIGAAAGLAVQGLIGNGLNQVASARYSLTGPWAHPHIVLIDKTALPQPRGIVLPPLVLPAAQVPQPHPQLTDPASSSPP